MKTAERQKSLIILNDTKQKLAHAVKQYEYWKNVRDKARFDFQQIQTGINNLSKIELSRLMFFANRLNTACNHQIQWRREIERLNELLPKTHRYVL